MTIKETPKKAAPKTAAAKAPAGERIAKVLSRAGVASRREAERMIELGQVAVNGKVIDSPALNVTPKDRITVDGQPLAEAQPPRLWLYYKPEGLVTSASDEKGRATVFDNLPEDLPRVMSVGRLDLNSEGLLLLTNDGELKRRLELPSTGWLRKYRVRINGNPTEPDLEPLRVGITVDGERFQPMAVTLDRHQGANAWLTVGLREGKNREIRRALNAINLTVNRLIRVSYGPFRLGDLTPGQVEEVKTRVLMDQLGTSPQADDAPAKPRSRTTSTSRRSDAPPAVASDTDALRVPTRRTPSAPRASAPRDAEPPRPATAKRGVKPRGSADAAKPGLASLSAAWADATSPAKPARAKPAAPRAKTNPRGAGAMETEDPTKRSKAGYKPKVAAKPAARPKSSASPDKPSAKPRGKPGPKGGRGE